MDTEAPSEMKAGNHHAEEKKVGWSKQSSTSIAKSSSFSYRK
jgi:hypothetical protein